MPSINLRLDHHQQQGISPRLQHAVRLLQMSSLDYAQSLQTVAVENPFLELPDDAPEAAESSNEADADADSESSSDEGDPEAPLDLTASSSAGDGESDSWVDVGTTKGSRDALDGGAFTQRAAEASLAQHLHGQLQLLTLPLRDMLLASSLVESLDDDGYLRIDLDELTDIVSLDPPAAPDELRIALARVQSLEPAGVGARSIVECLLLQTDSIASPEQRQLARRIIADDLEGLARKNTVALAAKLPGSSVTEVETVCDLIRRFDPRPGWRFGSADIRYVTSDVTVKKLRGRWTAQLNDAIVPKVRLHHVYAEMFERQQRGKHPELALQLREARWTVRNIEQRFATILGVAQAIVHRQQDFFEHGPLAMKPLALRDIAKEVGVHESTVSRVTNNKYMATPVGLFELKHFFSRPMTATSGTEFTGTAIRALMTRMLETETADQPLSDAQMTRLLARQGLVVTRRTVTKYRHLLQVDSAQQRRKCA